MGWRGKEMASASADALCLSSHEQKLQSLAMNKSRHDEQVVKRRFCSAACRDW
jgi:hypothetical protein